MPTSSLVTSIDIINLSHSLKDICEVDCKCKTPDCMNTALKTLMQYNLIKLNLLFSEQLDCIANRPRCDFCTDQEEKKDCGPGLGKADSFPEKSVPINLAVRPISPDKVGPIETLGPIPPVPPVLPRPDR